MSKRKIAFVHTALAAVAPLMQFYTQAAPELALTNVLEDGLLNLLAEQRRAVVLERLIAMSNAAEHVYQAEVVIVSCSSVTLEMISALRESCGVPVLKVDYPMAQCAVRAGHKIGLLATFAPTIKPTSNMLLTAAAEANTKIEIIPEIIPEAYQALLAGDLIQHDALLQTASARLAAQGVDAIVLAQISMARLADALNTKLHLPVFNSLDTSLAAVRGELDPLSAS